MNAFKDLLHLMLSILNAAFFPSVGFSLFPVIIDKQPKRIGGLCCEKTAENR